MSPLFLLAAALACEPLDLDAAKTTASTKLAEGDAQGALAIVRDARGRLECANSLADPVTLSLLFQVGVASAADDATRRELAADAVRFGPGVGCRSVLGTTTCNALDTARNGLENTTPGRVAADGEVWLDGVRLPAGAERSVAPGRHLVQTFDGNARVVSTVVDVPSEAPMRVGVATKSVATVPTRNPLRLPLAAGGVALAAGGTACVAVAFYDAYDKGGNDALTANDSARYNTLLGLGYAAVGAGAALSVGSAFLTVGPSSVVVTGVF